MAATHYPYTQLDAKDRAPFIDAAAVTPSDTTDLTYVTRGLYVGGAGNLVVDTAAGNTVTFTGVPVGTTLYLQVKRVRATSTTATAIVALY